MALRNGWGDIRLICDDDELMEADYEVTIIGQYLNHKDSIVNTLSLIRKDCARTYLASPQKLGFLNTLHTNSLQISLYRKLILDNNILFDEMMGSGTGNGGEEENRFMMDCYKTGYSVKNYDKYNECISMRVMLYSAFEGFFENRINKCAKKFIGVNKLMISTPLYYNVKPLLLAA